jgi:DNA-binding NarL/FixJ family response regulator
MEQTTNVDLRPMFVLIVSAHPVIDQMVRSAAEAAGSMLTRTVALGTDLAAIADHPASIVVVDVDGDERPGLRRLREVNATLPQARPVVLSDRAEGSQVLTAMRLGAWAVVRKPEGLRELSGVLLRVAAGERVLPPDLERSALAELGRFAQRAREGSSVEATITEREREILSLLSEGFTTQQAGRRLGISPRTVETHVAKLYRKLSVRTRLQAIARAVHLGLIQLDREP